MRFKGLDLNLLVALDALLSERNVSRSAKKLNIGQSATSDALARLRDYFEDELLIQAGRQMVLTAQGQLLRDKVRNVLLEVDNTVVRRPVFDKALERRTVRILVSDYVVVAGLAHAIENLAEEAPGVSIVIEQPAQNPADRLSRGEVDFLIMPDVYISTGNPSAKLFSDDYVVLMWEERTIPGKGMSAEDFLDAPHVSLRFPTSTPSFDSWFLEVAGSRRRVEVTTGAFSNIPFLLIGTDCVSLMPRRLAIKYRELLPLKFIPCPIPIPPLEERIQWNRVANKDGCLRWLRERIMQTLA